MKIYKLTKPSDTMTVYIGKTSLPLNKRLNCHKCEAKRFPDRKVYKWYDNTCIIELIEEYSGDNSGIREMEIVQEYIDNGYNVMNDRNGESILNPNYIKEKNRKNYIKYKNLGKIDQYISNRTKMPNAENNQRSRICRAAKKEGLTSKEYKIKHNL